MLNFFKKKRLIELKAPVSGTAIELSEVPDEVFAQKIVGDGIAIQPEADILYAPVSGKITQISPTKHALGITTTEGLELLIHIGIDTVELKGEGFKTEVAPNQKIRAGERLMTFDRQLIASKAKSTAVLLIITNMDRIATLAPRYGLVQPGTTVLQLELK